MKKSTDKVRVTGEALSELRKISYIAIGKALHVSQKITIGHCALMGRAVNNWSLYVMCRPHTKSDTAWQSITTTFPSTEVKFEHNDVEVTLPPLEEAYEIAVFGRLGKTDLKRMQLALYGCAPKAGANWTINVELYDDISAITQQVREKHLKLGNKLLTARAGLFVANSDDHIKIELSALDAAFQIKGSAVKEISSRKVWNPPEDALDRPTLVYEIAHVDESRSTFFGKIRASHVGDHVEAYIMADFEKDAHKTEVETSCKDEKDHKVIIEALDTISRETKKENSAVSQNCIKIPRKQGVKIPGVFFTLAVILMVSVSQCNDSNDNQQRELGFMQTVHGASCVPCSIGCKGCQNREAEYEGIVILILKMEEHVQKMQKVRRTFLRYASYVRFSLKADGTMSIMNESGEKHNGWMMRLTKAAVNENGEKLNEDQTKTETMVLPGQQLSYDRQQGDLKRMTGNTNGDVFDYASLERISESTNACSFKGVSVGSNVRWEKRGRSESRKKRVSCLTPPSRKRSFKEGSSRTASYILLWMILVSRNSPYDGRLGVAQNGNASTPADSKEPRWNLEAGLKILARETEEPDGFTLSAMRCMKPIN